MKSQQTAEREALHHVVRACEAVARDSLIVKTPVKIKLSESFVATLARAELQLFGDVHINAKFVGRVFLGANAEGFNLVKR